MAREEPGWVNLLPPRWRNEIDKETARAITVRRLRFSASRSCALDYDRQSTD